MTVELDTDAIVEAFEGQIKDPDSELAEAMRRGFTASQDRLNEAISQRAGIDSEGRTGRQDNGMFSILQSGQYIGFDESDGTYKFVYTHFAAPYHEWGTAPHEITAKTEPFLAFKWPDAPDDVVAMFTPGGDDEVNRSEWDGWVYFQSVEHPGTPAIGFVRHGLQKAREYLEEVSE